MNSNSASDHVEIYPDPASFERAVRYSRTRQWLVIAGMLWNGTINVLSIVTGLSSDLRNRTTRVAPRRVGPPMLYALVLSLFSFFASLPLSYLSGYVVEHRYQLSNQSRPSWLAEQTKGFIVGVLLSLPIVQGVYWILGRYPRRWWAVLSGLAIPFTVLLVNLAPILILPLFNTFRPLRDRALAERIKALASGRGVRISDVLEMDMSKQTKKANAFFTGIGNTRRIVLGDTLLEEFTQDEVEVVVAHELAHQVHHDLWKLIGLGAITTTMTLYTVHRLAGPAITHFGARYGLDAEKGVQDVAALPLLGILSGGASLALLPIQNAITRRFIEHPADRFALEITGKRQAFLSAMEKLGRMNLSNPRPSSIVKWLMYDHPTLQERMDFGRLYPESGTER